MGNLTRGLTEPESEASMSSETRSARASRVTRIKTLVKTVAKVERCMVVAVSGVLLDGGLRDREVGG